MDNYTCVYCDKEFKTNNGYQKHKCSKKDRFINKDQDFSVLGFCIWYVFMETSNFKITDDPETQFLKSSDYNSFCSIAKYFLMNPVQNIEEYIKYVTEKNYIIYQWTDPQIIALWLVDYQKNLDPLESCVKNLEIINEWAIETGNSVSEYYDKVSSLRFIKDIEQGNLSPWVIYSVKKETGNKIFNRMSSDELAYIFNFLNPDIWVAQAYKHRKVIAEIQQIYKDSNYGW